MTVELVASPEILPKASATPLSLYDDAAVAEACGLSQRAILWPPLKLELICDPASAARWILDRLRRDAVLRRRYPKALSEGAGGAFGVWLAGRGGDAAGITGEAKSHVLAVLGGDFKSRALEAVLWSDDLRETCPLALLPPGRRTLARWLFNADRSECRLSIEESWWLLLSAAEQPEVELARTYLNQPLWQQAVPHGLTVFGRSRLAGWLAQRYGLDQNAAWLDPSSWPEQIPVDQQVRLAYAAEPRWRAVHPQAFANEGSARALLVWLGGPDADLPHSLRVWCRERLKDGTSALLAAVGANFVGHFCYTSGLKVSLDALANGTERAGGQVARRNMHTTEADEPQHSTFLSQEPYDVTVMHVQPEPFFATCFERALIHRRKPETYKVAYWYWELDHAPEPWADIADGLDEVWVATTFVADALRSVCRRPVITLFPGVQLVPFKRRPLKDFGLRGDCRFTFLFSFHMASVMERKNPIGLIAAFQRAFGAHEPVDLVLKTTSHPHHSRDLEKLKAAVHGSNVTILDRTLDAGETLALMDACDAYVSLHRSEGLGLTLAEAMLLGKPVIATRYSGNTDFMSEDDSLLVDHTMQQVGPGTPPYNTGALWANPSVEHAAILMRRIYDDRAYGQALGERARLRAESHLSVAAAGARVVSRLAEIKDGRSSFPLRPLQDVGQTSGEGGDNLHIVGPGSRESSSRAKWRIWRGLTLNSSRSRPPPNEGEYRVSDGRALVRTDLDGSRLYVPGRPEVWLVFHGLRHHVTSPQVYEALFIGVEGHTSVETVDDIKRGFDLNEGTCLVRGDGADEATYLVTGFPTSEARKHHVSSWETFLSFGFDERLVRTTPWLVLSTVPTGRALRTPEPGNR